jgi:ribonuclease-3
MNQDYHLLEEKIEYEFQEKELLINALTHTSFANEHKAQKVSDNERLEFLGDAVLEMVSSEFLYKHMKKMSEGEMSKLRASLVCEPTLALDAQEIELPEFIYLGKGEEATGGRTRASIVSDALEALIGAIFLDGGIEAAKDFIYRVVLNDIDKKRMFHDSKTILQERIDAVKSGTLSYKIIKESGPDHNKTFEAVAMLNDRVIGQGTGQNKKTAEQQAAYQALKQLEK